jgi:oxidase EvaA
MFYSVNGKNTINFMATETKKDAGQLFSVSWLNKTNVINELADILAWISGLNKSISVNIHKTTLAASGWYYKETSGQIVNANLSFFQIAGFRQFNGHGDTFVEQPIIIQDEIGYLGILCKEFDGVLYFLMQAKIEPGNVNKIQLSPTIQATKSNFMQKHGGAKPAYLDYFLNASRYTVIVDQIQSEQSSRFLKKRNRNIIILVDDEIAVEESPTHKWLTLYQIKQLMKIDNLVNMDTRTVISCIPFCDFFDGLAQVQSRAQDIALIRSITDGIQADELPQIYQYINNYKMFNDVKSEIVPLYSLKKWAMCETNGIEEFVCKDSYPFKVVFCDIFIEGREVKHWGQPLFEAIGMACFGLFTAIDDGVRFFLVQAKPEVGCFDKIELGPTIQMEAMEHSEVSNTVEKLFLMRLQTGEGIRHDVILSEEGGRFYHEQNRNVIIDIEKDEIAVLPDGYFWLTYRTLNRLVKINNCLNIQLRNLLSLLEIG